MPNRQRLTNGFGTTLALAMGSGATTATVGSAIPTAGADDRYDCVIDNEIVGFTACNTTVWTVLERGADETTPASHVLGATVRQQLTRGANERLLAVYQDGVLSAIGSEIDFTSGAVVTQDGDLISLAISEPLSNPMTDTDDLILGAAGGTPARLAKGDDSQVLTIDPVTHHVAWDDPPGGAPVGAAGGDLDGTYPDPDLAVTGVTAATYGDASHIPQLAIDAKGRITSASDVLAAALTNPMTTAGDIIVATSSGVPTRKAKGSDSQVFTIDPVTHLPIWKDPAMTNPMTTLDDIIIAGASGVPVRLAKGSNGKVLTVDASTGHVVWNTPAFVSPLTTRGDLLTENSTPAPARLAVGAANSVLKSDGTDPSWTTAPTLAGILTATALVPSGLTGSVAATRFVGGTASVAPTTGAHLVGDFVVTQTGHIYVCTVLGTPGTWVDAGTVASAVSSVFTRTGAVVAVSGDYTAAQVTNAADLSSATTQAFTGKASATALIATGLTGAIAASRYVGATASAAPASGTFLLGDVVVTQDGHVFICTTAGSPGTWADAGSAGSFSNPMTTAGDLILGDTGGAPIRLAKGTDLYVLSMSASTHLPVWAAAAFINPMTTQDDLMVGGASGAPGRLAKGSDGQVLTVNASTHHLDWETPASGFSNPLTTRGDLIVETAGPTTSRLAVGAAGQRLKSDGTDVAWGDDLIDLNFVIDGGGAAIATGLKGYLHISQALTIVQASLLADQSSSIVVNIWKCTYTQFDASSTHPVVGDKITNTTPPTLSSATKSKDTTLSSWTTSIAADDVLAFNVDSNSLVQRVTVMLKCKRAS